MPLHLPGSRARSALLVAVAVPLVASVLHVPAMAADHAAPPPVGTVDTPTSTHRVTLVTGDVVRLTTLADGKQTATVERPLGATGGVSMQTRRGDLYVIPDEAVGLIGADRLDTRLFDVTGLVKMGYTDSKSGRVPMIAAYSRAATKADATPAAPRASRVSLRLPAVRSTALTAPKRSIRSFWNSIAPAYDPTDGTPTLQDGISKLWLDGKVETTLHDSVPQIGAPEAWADGYDGTGVTVALLDSGLDVHHPDLSTQVAATQSFVPGETIADQNGHGTHVGSTIVGTGAAQDGYYKGVAPGAKLDVGKVTDEHGEGQDSWIMAGMEWAAQKGDRIVNMSLGDPSYTSDGTDPLAQEVDALSAQYGTLFVIASGNNGPRSVTSPGTAASALTVGAVDDQDQLAWFSSGGPVAGPGGAIKPDLTAPGVGITAAKSGEMGDGSSELYQTLDGTSMATPHVSGSAAILAQEHPGWTGQQIKDQLMSTAKGLEDYSPFDVGTGRVDVAAAVEDTVRATGSLSFGNYLWPHDPSQVATTKDITFSNDGDQSVALDLALHGGGNAFTLSTDALTVPAHGTATVHVTGDPQAADIGTDGGWIVATDVATDREVTRTAVGLIKEDERYNLTISLKDRSGQPASAWVTLNQAGSDARAFPYFVDGSLTMRMPAGTYQVSTILPVPGEAPDRSGQAFLVDPEIDLHQDTDATLDASQARLLQTTAPQASVASQRKIDVEVRDDHGTELRSAYEVAPQDDDLYVSPTQPMSSGSFMLTTRWRMEKPLLGLTVGSQSFTTLLQPGSALGMRTDTAATVYAGDGSRDAYRKISAHGKIVVVDRSDAVSPVDQAAAAESNGALGLIVVNDGIGGLNQYVGQSSIPVASVHRDAGDQLVALAKTATRATLRQQLYSPFVYDLTRDYPGHVPDQPLVYHPKQSDLAKIKAHYYAANNAGVAQGYRYDLTLTPTLGEYEPEKAPASRVEWVTPGQVWVESHAQKMDGPVPWEMDSGVNSYRKGRTTDLDWFRPAVGPGFSDAFAVKNERYQDYLTWNVQGWSSFSDNMRLGGYLPWGATPTKLQVFRGSNRKPFFTNPFSADMQGVLVPPGNKPYRVVLDQTRPAGLFRLSTRTHSEWRFRSDTAPGEDLVAYPVLKLGFRLGSDLRGNIAAGKKQRIALRPSSSITQAVPGKLGKVKLGVSFNGKTWKSVTLTKGSNGWWQGTFTAPRKSGGYVSVRGSAATNAGYSVSQTIIRAYGVK